MIKLCDTVEEFEAEAEKWTLKFPRKYRAERIRGLPSMRQTFDKLFRSEGVPPSLKSFRKRFGMVAPMLKQNLKTM